MSLPQIRIWLLVVVVSPPVAQGAVATGASTSNFRMYRDADYRFAFSYPDSWERVPISYLQTRIKVVSNRGQGIDGCNVVTSFRPALIDASAKDYVASVSNRESSQSLRRKRIPDFTVENSGTTALGGRVAFYEISAFTHKATDLEFPTKQLQVATIDDGYLYIVTCSTAPSRFDRMLPIFRAILLGFEIEPD